MSAVTFTLNEKFSNAFFKEFAPTNPSTDPVFSRVNAIALHSLTTGILILSLNEPEETRYRQIPPSKLIELRSAVEQFNDAMTQGAIEHILKEIRTNPENFLLAQSTRSNSRLLTLASLPSPS